MNSYFSIVVFCTFSVITICADHHTHDMSDGSPFSTMMGAKSPFGLIQKGACPNFSPQESFNLTRFLGTWYPYEAIKPAGPLTLKCQEFSYKPGPNGHIDHRITAIKEMEMFGYSIMKVRVKIHGDLIHTDGTSFSLSFSGYHDMNFASYTVVATDYDTFAVIHNCYKLPMLPVSAQNAAILTRERGVAPMKLDKIKTRLSDYNVDVSKFQKTDQTDCIMPYDDTKDSAEPVADLLVDSVVPNK